MAVPQGAPDHVVVRLQVDRLRHRSGEADGVSIQGVGATRRVNLTETDYYGEITEISPLVVPIGAADRSVTIRGRAVNRSSGAGAVAVPLNLLLRVSGFEKAQTLITDGNGEFEFSFRPNATDSGRYVLSAVHPDVLDRPDQGSFTIESLTLRPATFAGDIVRGLERALATVVTAGRDTQIKRLRLEYAAEDQPGGVFAAGVTVTTDAPRDLAAGSSAQIGFRINADAAAAQTGRVVLRLVADAVVGTLGAVTVDYRLTDAAPALTYSPTFIELGLAREASTTAAFSIGNAGFAPILDGTLVLRKTDGSAAPDWLYLSSGTSFGTLAQGESAIVEMTAAPGAAVAESDYEFRLIIEGSNVSSREVPVYIAVTESGVGGLLVHASDIYTATLDENNEPIPGLQGARIKLQNEQVLTQLFELTTDAFGNARFDDLPSGNYYYRATAPDHQDASGRVRIQPGVIGAQEVFLTNQLVTVEWSVQEVTLQDRYDVRLEATFRTNVPAAVLLLEPLSVNLPRLEEGEIYYGELRLTNYGLVKAEQVRTRVPRGDDYLQFEFLTTPPEEMYPSDVFTIPYRITALRDFDAGTDGDASGGAVCVTRDYSYEILGEYTCAVGVGLPCGAFVRFTVSPELSECQAQNSSPGFTGPTTFSSSSPGSGGTSGGVIMPKKTPINEEGSGCILGGLLGGCRNEGEGAPQ